jgi:hypothetical protein
MHPELSTMSDFDPNVLRINAWCGKDSATSSLAAASMVWGATSEFAAAPANALAAPIVDLNDWRSEKVGWGVVLPDNAQMSDAHKARALDAPQCIRDLLLARNEAPVFRYSADIPSGSLRRYFVDGRQAADLNLQGARGMGTFAVPHYLLIVASPADIPWKVQYRLQTECFVGRLDLAPQGLEHYVDALIHEWPGAPRDVRQPVIWAVDHGYPDITRLMRKGISDRLYEAFRGDAEIDSAEAYYTDDQATQEALLLALSARSPAFVATSSHGATFPLDDSPTMKAQLGVLVDRDQALANVGQFASGWDPRGTIFYAHACCSAGCDDKSQFEDLVGADTTIGRIFTAVSRLGATTAPLPKALLGADRPLGAFIGHVEPTFDWSLRDTSTGQLMTQPIIGALYGQLHLASRPTVGRAMNEYFKSVAGLLFDHSEARQGIIEHRKGAPDIARRSKLIALDRLSMVILGDPTVRLPDIV